ncbi:MAG: type II toxin-antitoxin system RelE/ParE family toxin [Candidatus Moraniibacteriota bacterium]
MERSFHISRKAEEDILGCMRYLLQKDTNLPARFLASFEETCKSLLDMPALGKVRTFECTALLNIREIPMRTFKKYLIFYRAHHEDIEIVRVIHGARDLPTIFVEG